MTILNRRNLLRAAGAAALLASGRSALAANQQLRLGYQRSSTILTILKNNRTLDQQLGPKGFEVNWYLFNDVISPMTSGTVDFHADVADAVPIFTQAAGAKLTIYAREAPSPWPRRSSSTRIRPSGRSPTPRGYRVTPAIIW